MYKNSSEDPSDRQIKTLDSAILAKKKQNREEKRLHTS
jgi:hypothetical protein